LKVGFDVNVGLGLPKVVEIPQVDRRLWSHKKLQMMINLWQENNWEYHKQPMATKD
jgi:hypothetical protein